MRYTSSHGRGRRPGSLRRRVRRFACARACGRSGPPAGSAAAAARTRSVTLPPRTIQWTPSARSTARSRRVSKGRPGPGSASRTTVTPAERQRRRVGGDAVAEGDVPVDPRGGVEARVAAGERPRVADRPPERDDDRRRARPRRAVLKRPASDGEDGDERQDVAVEVRVRGKQRERVGSREREQHEVAPLAPAERDDDADGGDEEHRADRLPEPEPEREAASQDRPRTRAIRPGPAAARDGSPPTPPRRGSRRTGS